MKRILILILMMALIDIQPVNANGSQDQEYLRNNSNKIIMNFQAKTISLTSTSLYGTVLAPKADITGSAANITGNTVAKSLDATNGFELHVGSTPSAVPTSSPKPPSSPTPTSTPVITPSPTSTPTVEPTSTPSATPESTPIPSATPDTPISNPTIEPETPLGKIDIKKYKVNSTGVKNFTAPKTADKG